MRVTIFLIFVIIITVECTNNRKTKPYSSVSAILDGRPITNLAFKNYPTGRLRYLLDSLEGKSFGNLFEFFQNSAIKNYSFIVDANHSTYVELFDSVSHAIQDIQGIPIVYKTVDADMDPDSLAVEYLISDFSWDNIELSVSDDGKTFINAQLNNHLVLKFIKSVKLYKNTKSLSRVYLIARFKGKLKNREDYRVYFDTIDITRNVLK